MLPSSFDRDGTASVRQHFSCILVNDRIAVDAGSLGNAATASERSEIRDVVLTHAHLDHIAGLPLFIDDLFPVLTEPVRVHATRDVINVLEQHIFNWQVYPRFSELTNRYGSVIEYREIEDGREFGIRDLRFTPVAVNHKVPSTGFLVSDGGSQIAISGDTAEMDGFWDVVNALEEIDALLIECAFPNEFDELSSISHHLTPKKLETELAKFKHDNCPIYVINIKPAYREAVVNELKSLSIERLRILEIGREYEF